MLDAIGKTVSLLPAHASDANLTPEGLMIYVQSHMNDVDGRVSDIFTKQKALQTVRQEINNIQQKMKGLNEDTNNSGTKDFEAGTEASIEASISKIATVDPSLADRMRTDLTAKGQILWIEDGKYLAQEVVSTKSYLDDISKSLDGNSQMDMIQLQSLMSTRQTAIQLATNLISGLGESSKAIASNIR